MHIMPKKYAKKRSSIGIKKDDIAKINKVLYPNEKLSKFGNQAIDNEIKLREDKKLAELNASEQYHKIKTMENDIEDLKKKTDFLNSDLNKANDEIHEWGKVAIEIQESMKSFSMKTKKEVEKAIRTSEKLGIYNPKK